VVLNHILPHFSFVLGYGLFEAQFGFDANRVIRMLVYRRLLLSGHIMI
jgi:hypothetical protein